MVGQKYKNNITGRHPQFPQKLGGQKVSLKVSPTNPCFQMIWRNDDY
jgi:hypothetical protein